MIKGTSDAVISLEPLRFRIARWVMDHRKAVSILFVVLTLGFLGGFPRVEVRTIFKDLLPKDDPFVQVYYDHPNFGNPLTMSIMIKRKKGDIYDAKTLEKVWKMTRDIDLAPGIDHDQLISIATEKLRYAEATPYGIDMRPLMEDHVPSTPEEVHDFKRRIEQSPNARTFYVSRDDTATLINATFLDTVDYGAAFTFAHDMVEQAQDIDHEVYLAGQPVLTGWVYKLQKQTYKIFAITLGLLALALVLYMRNIAGVVTPIVCAVVAAIWGVGFIGWLKSAYRAATDHRSTVVGSANILALYSVYRALLRNPHACERQAESSGNNHGSDAGAIDSRNHD